MKESARNTEISRSWQVHFRASDSSNLSFSARIIFSSPVDVEWLRQYILDGVKLDSFGSLMLTRLRERRLSSRRTYDAKTLHGRKRLRRYETSITSRLRSLAVAKEKG